MLRRILAECRADSGRDVGRAGERAAAHARADAIIAMALEGRPFRADGTDPLADYRVVTARYFETMGIPVLRGRVFTDDDANARYTPIVISQGLAREIWGDDTDPVGHRLRFGPNAPWMPIIGVVADAKNRSLTETLASRAVRPRTRYLREHGVPLGDHTHRSGGKRIRAVSSRRCARGRERRSRGPDVRGRIAARRRSRFARADDRRRRDSCPRTRSRRCCWQWRARTRCLSYLVTQRRRELAVRMALGASPREIVSLVAKESGLMIGAGVVVGLLGALALARLLAGLLYGVGALDAGVVLGGRGRRERCRRRRGDAAGAPRRASRSVRRAAG